MLQNNVKLSLILKYFGNFKGIENLKQSTEIKYSEVFEMFKKPKSKF